MDIKYLNYIVEIAEHKNLTRAAASLYVSTSSLSQYLTRLEEEMGTALFYRKRTEMVPTKAGQIYIEGARKAIALKQDIYRNIADLSGGGLMSIGVTSQWSISLVMKVLPILQESYPDLTFEITELRKYEARRLLSLGKLDFILLSVGDEAGFASADGVELLEREEILFAVSKEHDVFKEEDFLDGRIALKSLKKHFGKEKFMICQENSDHGADSSAIFRAADMVPEVLCNLNTALSVARMVDLGLGTAFLPAGFLKGMDHIRGLSVGNGYFRKNILAVREGMVMGETEKAFLSTLKSLC